MSARLRLLYTSNAFWCTSGYGVQGWSLLTRLAELPEFGGDPGTFAGRQNMAQFAWYGQEGGMDEKQGFRIYPRFDDAYGNDVIGAHTQHFGANIVVSLIDVWVMHQTTEKVKPALWCPWLPIDHDPIPQQFLDSLAGAHLPLTYAKWGHKMLTDAGVANHYIPHGIEPSIYKVLDDRDEVRRFKQWLTGDENCFLCVMVAANKGFPSRKFFEGQLEAFRDFERGKPNCKLYIHSLPMSIHGGVEFQVLITRLGLEGKIIFPHPYLYRLGYPPEHLALVYNAADVLLSCSMSEGFGIPIVEAQACGTPALVTDFSAMPELLRWGYKVSIDHLVLTGMHSYQAWPSIRDITDKLNRLYDAWLISGGEWPMSKRIETQNAIHAEYDWNAIVRDQWQPLITRLAAEAPPLDARFQAPGVSVQNDASAFVNALNEELAKDTQRVPAVVPRRRVAPLATPEPQPTQELTFEQAFEISKQKRKSAAEVAQMMEAQTNGFEPASNEEVAL